MKINKTLSLNGCWRLVNACQNGDTPQEIRMRCAIAEEWLNANTVISIEEYDELMRTAVYLIRESYHVSRESYYM